MTHFSRAGWKKNIDSQGWCLMLTGVLWWSLVLQKKIGSCACTFSLEPVLEVPNNVVNIGCCNLSWNFGFLPMFMFAFRSIFFRKFPMLVLTVCVFFSEFVVYKTEQVGCPLQVYLCGIVPQNWYTGSLVYSKSVKFDQACHLWVQYAEQLLSSSN